jgi:IS5 family transposase
LESLNLVAKEGKIVDASFIEVPKQRNTREENETIKGGGTPETFLANQEKARQKDVDARWTKKNNVSYFGYKNHIKVDLKSKLIVKYTVTDASGHGSQALGKLLETNDLGQELYADSAYTGPKQEAVVEKDKMVNKICEKGCKNKPLAKEQEESNRAKSRPRPRVEHIYGFMEMSMNGVYLYAVGKKRVGAIVGPVNLAYNMFRPVQLNVARQGERA